MFFIRMKSHQKSRSSNELTACFVSYGYGILDSFFILSNNLISKYLLLSIIKTFFNAISSSIVSVGLTHSDSKFS